MKVVLCILDGWGVAEPSTYNAIFRANTPVWDKLTSLCDVALLDCSGSAVGLPDKYIGNSEVGHLTIGAGRVIKQDLLRINEKISALCTNIVFVDFIQKIKSRKGRVHIWGLFSPSGVHSHIDHILKLRDSISNLGLEICLHAVLDGRDSPPRSCMDYCQGFDIDTVSGRYYAMDRNNNWDRTEKAYNTIMYGQGLRFKSFNQAINDFYRKELSDEFIPPSVIGNNYDRFKLNDGLIVANFRPDRVKQILNAFVGGQPFSQFDYTDSLLTMVPYGDDYGIPYLFEKQKVEGTLGQIISDSGLSQLRIAETEKYPHVTCFLNGGRVSPFYGEERIMIPSPDVATYDLMPEMSAFALTDQAIENLGKYELMVINYANPDMVGHSGNLEASIKAVEVVDRCLGLLYDKIVVSEEPVYLFITADHGNVEHLFDEANNIKHTAHTLNKVPFLGVCNGGIALQLKHLSGGLSSIAPTIISSLGRDIPFFMEDVSLIF